MNKTIIRFGLISGLISAVYIAIFGVTASNGTCGTDTMMVIGYLAMLVAFSFIYVACHSLKQKQGGVISFKDAFLVGLAITAISSLFYAVAWLIVYKTLMPDFMDKYIAGEAAKMKASGMSAEKLSEKLKEANNMKELYKNPFMVVLITFFTEPFPVGLIVTIITSIIVSRKKKQAEAIA